MLDERKASILRAVVQEYIATGQPVGSKHVAETSGVSASPATIRNEMAALEQEGYLRQPHTSAGRVPTDRGYRFFVNSLSEPGVLAIGKANQVRSFFATAHGALEQMLHDTSQLLSNLTNYAAVVVGPPHEVASIRSIQLVPLTPRVVLVVAVLSNGVVEKRTLELDGDLDDDAVARASAHLAAHAQGSVLALLAPAPPTGDGALDGLLAQAHDSLRADADDPVYVGGASRMAAAFDAVETVLQVLRTLEQQYVVVTLLRDVLDRGLTVAIGAELGVEPLAACSVVVAPYQVEGEVAGTIGVLGPTRMNYPEALAAVELVSRRLGHRLSEG
jgi:heat-inducible transcriptional repressor